MAAVDDGDGIDFSLLVWLMPVVSLGVQGVHMCHSDVIILGYFSLEGS